MRKACDEGTRSTLDVLTGRRLQRVEARQYFHVGPYVGVTLEFEGSCRINLYLTDTAIAHKFEVFVIGARPANERPDTTGWDRLEFNDFVVARTTILSRDEWIEEIDGPPPPTVGSNPVMHRVGPAGTGPGDRGVVTVETGVRFTSTNHAELTLDADAFPMTFHLNYRAWSYDPAARGRVATDPPVK